ncbi:hypothetical protein AAF712_015161 [Marasmius tenuissimus]|uniref:Ubiquitin-like protease family profile domain-containing protein n=1 Tax=Marasmius tenuissimus TaxID=585030 RepID=A0ABR2ZB41_9AGAR
MQGRPKRLASGSEDGLSSDDLDPIEQPRLTQSREAPYLRCERSTSSPSSDHESFSSDDTDLMRKLSTMDKLHIASSSASYSSDVNSSDDSDFRKKLRTQLREVPYSFVRPNSSPSSDNESSDDTDLTRKVHHAIIPWISGSRRTTPNDQRGQSLPPSDIGDDNDGEEQNDRNTESGSEYEPNEPSYVPPQMASVEPQFGWANIDRFNHRFDPNVLLVQVEEDLSTLSPGAWIDVNPINHYLWDMMIKTPAKRLKCRYLPLEYHHAHGTHDLNSLDFYKEYSRTRNHINGVRLACTVVNPDNAHWWGVLADPDRRAAYIFGWRLHEEVDLRADLTWEEFNGPAIYKMLCAAHDWHYEPPSRVISTSWQQSGGTECGAHTVQVLSHIMLSGIEVGGNHAPMLPKSSWKCTHKIRIDVLTTAFLVCTQKLSAFMRCVHHDSIAVRKQVDKILPSRDQERRQLIAAVGRLVFTTGETTDLAQQYLERPLKELQEAMEQCSRCSPGSSEPQRDDTRSNLVEDGSPNARTLRKSVQDFQNSHPSILQHVKQSVIKPGEPDDGHIDYDDAEPPADNDTSNHSMASRTTHATRREPNLEQAPHKGRRFPITCSPPTTPKLTSSKLHVAFNERFDQYEGGPTLDALIPPDKELSTLGIRPNVIHSLFQAASAVGGAREWYDRGWRILPNFAQQFYLCKPWRLAQHLVPNLDDYSDHPAGEPRSGFVKVNLEEFLEITRNDPLFALHGQLPKNPIVPQKQAILSLTGRQPTKLIYGVDIDSYICVLKSPTFKAFVDVFATPLHRNLPPLYKHIHVYIVLLLPQSKKDQSTVRVLGVSKHSSSLPPGPARFSRRSEFFVQEFKLSQIPHMDLAHFPHGGALRIFFPRMTHKKRDTRYYATNIDFTIKKSFYEEILYPAVRNVKPQEEHQYAVRTGEQWEAHQGTNKTPSKISFAPDQMNRLIAEMTAMINDPKKQELRSQFGSCFFMLEIKGTKRFTHVTLEGGQSLADAITISREMLAKEMHYWDFEAAKLEPGCDPLFDLAVTITPPNPDNLVGMWKVDHVENSFSAAGHKREQPHRVADLDRVGGLQAETLLEHKKRSHVVSTSAYNLFYESVRTATNDTDSFTIQELATNSSSYRQDRDRRLSTLSKVSSQAEMSYGVRREFRLGDDALTILANSDDGLDNRLNLDHFKNAVIWVQRKHWCELLMARMNALSEAHKTIAMRPDLPENFIQLCGLFSYLMQSLTSTPINVPTFTRNALAVLQYGSVMSQQGMFLIGSLDLSKENIIPEIDEADARDLWRQVKLDRDPRKPSYQKRRALDPDADKSISRKYIARELLIRPWSVMRKWNGLPRASDLGSLINPSKSSVEDCAVKLFQLWTFLVWQLLKDEAVGVHVKPAEEMFSSVATIEEQLQFWTVESRFNDIRMSEFHVTRGEEGRDTFAANAMRWFDKRTEESKVPRTWTMFQYCYLPAYESTIEELESQDGYADGEGKVELDAQLKIIFSYCQCIPYPDARNPWTRTSQGAMKLMVNPAEYGHNVIRDSLGKRKRNNDKQKRLIRNTDDYLDAIYQGLGMEGSAGNQGRIMREFRMRMQANVDTTGTTRDGGREDKAKKKPGRPKKKSGQPMKRTGVLQKRGQRKRDENVTVEVEEDCEREVPEIRRPGRPRGKGRQAEGQAEELVSDQSSEMTESEGAEGLRRSKRLKRQR